MKSNESPGFLQRVLTALGGALKRGILGKSGHEYMKQFSGSDDYWNRVIAAQMDWPQRQPPTPDPDPDHFGDASNTVVPIIRASVRGDVPSPP